MKITKQQLKQIIKEEISKTLSEGAIGFFGGVAAAKQTADAMRNRKRYPSSSSPGDAKTHSYAIEGVSDEVNKAFGEAEAIVVSSEDRKLERSFRTMTQYAAHFGRQDHRATAGLSMPVYYYNTNRKYLTDALPLLDDVIPLVAGVDTERATAEDETRLLALEPKDRLVVPTQLKYTE